MSRGPCGECGKSRTLIDEITTTCGFVEFVCAECLKKLTTKTETTMKKTTDLPDWTTTKRSAAPGYAAYVSWTIETPDVLTVVCDDGSFVVGKRDGSACVTGKSENGSVAQAMTIAKYETKKMIGGAA